MALAITFSRFDFEVMLSPGKSHVMVDHLSGIESGKPTTGINDDLSDIHVFFISAQEDWYSNVFHLLVIGQFLTGSSPLQKRRLLLKSQPFTIINDHLYQGGPDGILRRCVHSHEVPMLIEDAHSFPSSGRFPGPVSAQKLLQCGLWWPFMFWDCVAFVWACNTCQRCGPKPNVLQISLFTFLSHGGHLSVGE